MITEITRSVIKNEFFEKGVVCMSKISSVWALFFGVSVVCYTNRVEAGISTIRPPCEQVTWFGSPGGENNLVKFGKPNSTASSSKEIRPPQMTEVLKNELAMRQAAGDMSTTQVTQAWNAVMTHSDWLGTGLKTCHKLNKERFGNLMSLFVAAESAKTNQQGAELMLGRMQAIYKPNPRKGPRAKANLCSLHKDCGYLNLVETCKL